MQVTAAPARSVAATARRAQIVAATIELIADSGYGQASFARIAERAGLSSTRLISYHFAGRGELIAAAAEEVISSFGAFMAGRMASPSTAPELLRAYIEGTIEYIASHRGPMKALMEIFLSGDLDYGPVEDQATVSQLESFLEQGQEDGDFRRFDPLVMATAIQRSVDGLPFLLQSKPDLDCLAYGRELVTLFDLATRSDDRPARKPQPS